MQPGKKRTFVARLIATFGCVCGVFGISMRPTDLGMNPGGIEWFAGGTLLLVFAVFLLLDGAVSFQKSRS